ncbi:MAG: hypothetical protein AUJ54_13025 [Ignavibacteria bacterium CG1_02_37_35]|nr:MAG: hypothetical protein AUJ54_13025 [Ignavibacteria bacterium CG1_02_37_35]
MLIYKTNLVILQATVTNVFFRADSGFFGGELFDYLEELKWEYLVKVKLKNLHSLLLAQQWTEAAPGITVCAFDYQAKGWKMKRTLKAIRTLTGYKESDYFGETQQVELYEYACYCSSLPLSVEQIHEKYKERSISENWIEQVKNQLLAGGNPSLWEKSSGDSYAQVIRTPIPMHKINKGREPMVIRIFTLRIIVQ